MAEREEIIKVDIEEEMKKSYLDYAMSVIVGRALPDVRDGLKPVQRRILFGMYEMGNTHEKPYRKSARIVGDVMGKYHPHGDQAIYDALVRMAQDFSLRNPLVDGQGNFGSIDGDMPAAMRYTEVRMEKLASEMIKDINKETVDFIPNYDGSMQEPVVLPSSFPNLIVNGGSGIAVGMATNIPPHNLGEVVDGLIHLIRNPEATVFDLMEFIKGPDFPTAGFIHGKEGLIQAYKTGRGKIKMRAKVLIEPSKKTGKECLIITELPYQVNKAHVIESIADLVRSKKLDGITDLRDESDRDGMRILIELRRGDIPEVIVNNLFKFTRLEETYGINMLALDNGQPHQMGLKTILSSFIEHRRQVIVRRTIYDLNIAEHRAHILEGLKKAIDNLDEVINIIRRSSDSPEAQDELMNCFKFSEEQAKAILDMRLARLTGLQREKLIEELKETLEQIKYFKEILADENKVMAIIVEDLEELKDKYGDARRTVIIDDSPIMSEEDLIADDDMVVSVTQTNYIKRTPMNLYRSQNRGGRGVTAMATKEEDFIRKLFVSSNHDNVLFFSKKGQAYSLKVYELPEGSRIAKGMAIVNLLKIPKEDDIADMVALREFSPEVDLVFVTRMGVIKRTNLAEYQNVRKNGINAIVIRPGDELMAACIMENKQDIILVTKLGKAIRFSADDVRVIGRACQGVTGIRLGQGDEVVGIALADEGTMILTVSENGYGKKTPVEKFRVQHRGGRGVIGMKVTKKIGNVVGMEQITDDDELMLISNVGILVRIKASQISTIGRATQGVKLIRLAEGTKVASIAKIVDDKLKE
ncbi:DNA gyrase subunit A [bacterium]|nr:DNA gyrase subunit A [bacterium]